MQYKSLTPTADQSLSDWELKYIQKPIYSTIYTRPPSILKDKAYETPFVALLENGILFDDQIRNRVLSRKERLREAQEILDSKIQEDSDDNVIIQDTMSKCYQIVEGLSTLQDNKKRDLKQVVKAYKDLKRTLLSEIEVPENQRIS